MRTAHNRTEFARTPRPTRSRVTVRGGRSPGSRVAVSDHLPGKDVPVANRPEARRLQLRGQPRHCTHKGARTAFPFDPYREPPRKSWLRHGVESRQLRFRGISPQHFRSRHALAMTTMCGNGVFGVKWELTDPRLLVATQPYAQKHSTNKNQEERRWPDNCIA